MAISLSIFWHRCDQSKATHYECKKDVCTSETEGGQLLLSEVKQGDVTYYELKEDNIVLASIPKYAARNGGVCLFNYDGDGLGRLEDCKCEFSKEDIKNFPHVGVLLKLNKYKLFTFQDLLTRIKLLCKAQSMNPKQVVANMVAVECYKMLRYTNKALKDINVNSSTESIVKALNEKGQKLGIITTARVDNPSSIFQTYQNIVIGPKKAGDIVPISYFKHQKGEDTEYILQRRDIDGDGILDEVGYPSNKQDAYNRPFTLSGETEDSFSYGRGAGKRMFRRGDVASCKSENKYDCPKPQLKIDGPESLYVRENGGGINRIEDYIEKFWETFENELDGNDRRKIAGLALRFLISPSKTNIKSAVTLLNRKMIPSEEMPRLNRQQIDLIADHCFRYRKVLLKTNLADPDENKSYKETAKELKRNPSSEKMLHNLRIGVFRAIDHHWRGNERPQLNIDRKTIEKIDRLFGKLELKITRKLFSVEQLTLKK